MRSKDSKNTKDRDVAVPVELTPNQTVPAIEVENVAASVGGVTVVSGVQLSIPPGAKVALIGINGAGKSTLLRALAGIEKPAEGAVYLDGIPLHSIRAKKRAQLVSFVSQEETPPADLTLEEMVALGRIPHRPSWAVSTADEQPIVRAALSAVGLADRMKTSCDRLSGGERRRAMLARGLAQQTPVLFLDEPTNHLDIYWTLQMLNLIRSLSGTVIVAMHDLDLVMRYFDHVVVLNRNRMTASGHPIDVFTPEFMNDTFGVEAEQIEHPKTSRIHLIINDVSTRK
ncbi:ABC transporter ATP-binding protein [Corynebacterium glucuronolyticum]|nr:ABC transporter, ATP-binding protein [Corynebacterium glucuronolyticum ATCC 51867]QRO82875.1 ABC transporter ATP-binding protein [Corynebacterium glucuronolyticum]